MRGSGGACPRRVQGRALTLPSCSVPALATASPTIVLYVSDDP